MADGGGETDMNIDVWKTKKLTKALESTRGNGTSTARDLVSRVEEMLGDVFGIAALNLCYGKPRSEALNELLKFDDKFGFIVMNGHDALGHGALFGTLSGNTREVLHEFKMDLPMKRGRNTERTALLDPLRMEKVHSYVRKAAELATQFYINPATSQPNVSGLLLAGSADFKMELSRPDMLDPRLQAMVLIVLKVAEVPVDRDDGFNEAIWQSSDYRPYARVIQEKRYAMKFINEVFHDTGKFVSGVDDTLKALEMGALETVILWESLETNRYVLKNAVTGELVIKHLSKEQEVDQSNFRDAETRAELEVQEKLLLVEWFAKEYKSFGLKIHFVTNTSEEGRLFCRISGGVGGILQYRLDILTLNIDKISDGEYGDYDEDD